MRKWRVAGTLVFVAQVLVAMPVKLQSQNLALQLQSGSSVLLKQLHIALGASLPNPKVLTLPVPIESCLILPCGLLLYLLTPTCVYWAAYNDICNIECE